MHTTEHVRAVAGRGKIALPTLKKSLAPFFRRHSNSTLSERPGRWRIECPWGDPTVALALRPKSARLIDDLNHVLLPPRFSAIWHVDSKDMEFIFTTLPVDSKLRNRVFEFVYDGRGYRCEYGDSSKRLLRIAAASRPVGSPTGTDHRNLYQFWLLMHYTEEHPDADRLKSERPTSFWIRNIEYEENALVDFSRLLNFYMTQFDAESPRIIIHEPDRPKPSAFKDPFAKTREFPSQIRSKRLDPYLLGLWESALNAPDPFRRFIYFYQVIEYCAFYHLTEDVLRSIKRVICTPDALTRERDCAREILDALVLDKMTEAQKFATVIERTVDPATLWTIIEPNAGHFATEVTFEGGFVLPPLIKANWSIDDFKVAWTPKFSDLLRKIRNALVHSRESRMVGNIAPHKENYHKLAPWLPLLRAAAHDTMLFGE